MSVAATVQVVQRPARHQLSTSATHSVMVARSWECAEEIDKMIPLVLVLLLIFANINITLVI